MTQLLNGVLYAMWGCLHLLHWNGDKIIVHNTLQRHSLYGFPVASISPENLHHFHCMVRPAAATTAGALVDLGKRAGENATHIKNIFVP